MKRKLRVFLLTVALIVMFIPIGGAVFADDPVPVSLTYSGADVYYYPDTYTDPVGFYTEGNTITEKFNDGSTKTYICKKAAENDVRYFLNGDVSKNEYGSYQYDEWFQFDIPSAGYPAGTTSIEFYLDDYSGDDHVQVNGSLSVKEMPKPVSLTYSGADVTFIPGGDEDSLDGFYTEGNTVTENYSDGSTKKYICKGVPNEDGDTMYRYFLNGDTSKDSDDYWLYSKWFEFDIPSGGIPAGSTSVGIYLEEYYGDSEIKVTGSVPVKEAPKPVSLSYKGAKLTYRAGDDWISEFDRTEGNTITETWSDGSTRTYILKSYKDEDGYTSYTYFRDGDMTKDEGGDFVNTMYFEIEYPSGGIKSGTKSLKFYRTAFYGEDEIKVEGTLAVSEKAKPVSATFSGKAVGEVYIGQKYIYLEDTFAKVGNKITVKYNDGTTAVYIYKKNKNYGGFYLNGNMNNNSIWGSANISKGLKKGKNSITLKIDVDDYKISMKATVTAKKLYIEPQYKTYVYSGKVIKPKIVVKDGYGKTVPAKAYTVKYENAKGKLVNKPYGKTYGYYYYKITIKKAYTKKYASYTWGTYSISTKAPTITKVTAGKNQITAKWKKLGAASGYVVECSLNKKFNNPEWWEFDGKNTTSGTVKNLKKGKTYFVRVRAYRKHKIGDTTEWVYSNPSKVLKVKVK